MNGARTAGKASRVVAAIVVLSMINGCYASFDVPVAEAPHLTTRGPVHEVKTVTGETKALDDEFKATVIMRDPTRRGGLPEAFQAPMISEIKDAMLIIQGQGNPEPVTIQLDRVSVIRIRQTSAEGTAGIVVGIVVGAAALIGLSVLAIRAATFQ